jgi:hypothetical protein
MATALILELAVVADATDCLGRELRREGESFAGGGATYAFNRLLVPWFAVLMLAGVLLVEPGAALVGVLDLVVGVLARFVGVWARVEGNGPFFRGVRPVAESRFVVDEGELDLVDAGLLRLDGLTFFTERGSREEGDVGWCVSGCGFPGT